MNRSQIAFALGMLGVAMVACGGGSTPPANDPSASGADPANMNPSGVPGTGPGTTGSPGTGPGSIAPGAPGAPGTPATPGIPSAPGSGTPGAGNGH